MSKRTVRRKEALWDYPFFFLKFLFLRRFFFFAQREKAANERDLSLLLRRDDDPAIGLVALGVGGDTAEALKR